MRHLFTLALGGILGVCLLAGDAEACHKKKCGGGCAPVACYQPAPCPKPVKTCGHAKKSCCGGGLFHKKGCGSHTTTVACNTGYVYGGGYSYSGYSYAAPVPSGQVGQVYAAPQATGQMYGTPPVPSKR
jgi:hypothetical protein